MTGNLFFDAFFIFLIVYAIIHICYEGGEFLIRKFSTYRHREFLLLPVSSGREELELDIRMAVKKSLNSQCALLILDLGLQPEEQTILWRITDPYGHVIIAEKHSFFEKLETTVSLNNSL